MLSYAKLRNFIMVVDFVTEHVCILYRLAASDPATLCGIFRMYSMTWTSHSWTNPTAAKASK